MDFCMESATKHSIQSKKYKEIKMNMQSLTVNIQKREKLLRTDKSGDG